VRIPGSVVAIVSASAAGPPAAIWGPDRPGGASAAAEVALHAEAAAFAILIRAWERRLIDQALWAILLPAYRQPVEKIECSIKQLMSSPPPSPVLVEGEASSRTSGLGSV
jgi:hypothetical protein